MSSVLEAKLPDTEKAATPTPVETSAKPIVNTTSYAEMRASWEQFAARWGINLDSRSGR